MDVLISAQDFRHRLPGETEIRIFLSPEDREQLERLIQSNGGLTAASTDPESPLRIAAVEICQRLFPTDPVRPWPQTFPIPAG